MREAPPAYGIIYNWDGNPVGYSEYPQSQEQFLHKVYAPIDGTQVGAHFWCVGEHEAEWPSDTMPVVGDSVGRVYETVWGMRRAESLRAMFERGEDPYAALVSRGHDLGVDVFASVRMNDNHLWSVGAGGETSHSDPTWWMSSFRKPMTPEDMATTVSSGLTQVHKDHPEWCLGNDAPAWVSTSWNMAIPEVRALQLNHISEACRLAEWDGLELDWQRHAFHLPQNDAYRLRYALTDLQRSVRRLTDRIANERGRPFFLAVRVAATLESCRRIGYDIESWADEGLCDIVIPAGCSGTDPGVDMEGFAQLLDGRGIKLYPGLDTDFRLRSRRTMSHNAWRDGWLRGTAAEFWGRGADGMYVFNWHATDTTKRGLLTTIGSPDTLKRHDMVYAAVHGVKAPRGSLRAGVDHNDRIYAETPVTLYRTIAGDGPTFRVPFSEESVGPAEGRLVQLTMEIERFSTADELEVRLDGEVLGAPTVTSAAEVDHEDPSDVDENTWLVWSLGPREVAAVKEVRVRLVARDPRLAADPVIRHVEIHVTYPRGEPV